MAAARVSQVFSLPTTRPAFEQVVTDLSHAFYTPLTVIDNATSILLRHRHQLSDQEQDEMLQMAQQAGRQLERLSRQLVEIAQFEAGAITLSPSAVDLAALARVAVRAARNHVPAPLRRQFRFALHYRDAQRRQLRGPAQVSGDQRRLAQLLALLLDNAIQYSPQGGKIDLVIQPTRQAEVMSPAARSSRMTDASRAPAGMRDELIGDPAPHEPLEPMEQAPYWEICVCDYGIGISDEHLERIFDAFYRVDTRLTREYYGVGLSLTLCRHLVSLHQGRIWAESCPDGGSAFHVLLPREQPLATV
jgi:signal transduction histidine kinase